MKHVEQTIKLLENAKYYYMLCTDMLGNYSYVNHNYASRFTHINADMIGKPATSTMHPDDWAACSAAGRECLMNSDILVPCTIRKHDGLGGYIITQWEFKGMFDDSGVPLGVFCLGYDITEFMTQLEKQNMLLTDIAFSQSHIIRRPVANILGAADLLKSFSLPKEVNEILDILIESTNELDGVITKIVNDIRS